MRLLIATQIVDTDDAKLGFFHHWLEAFASKFESIEVICLKEGRHTLPAHVHVHSLGKEKGGNRFLYALRFYNLAWKLRHEYDAVFVHMNPEYVLVAGDLWRVMGKKVGLWYNHTVGSLALRLTAPFVDILFHTSPYAYTARYKRARLMSAGIDTDMFRSTGAPRTPNSIYVQGRISVAKRTHILLAALRTLRESVPATLTLVGPEDPAYSTELRRDFADLIAAGAVDFRGPVRNEETPELFSTHAVAVNLAADGNFDKTALEPMACATPVIVSSRAFADLVPPEWRAEENNVESLAQKLSAFFALTDAARAALGTQERLAVVKHHSLTALGEQLAAAYAKK